MLTGLWISQACFFHVPLIILVPAGGRGYILLMAIAVAKRPGPAVPCHFNALFTSRIPSHSIGQLTRPRPLIVGGKSTPQVEMGWGEGSERLLPVDDLVSSH